MENIEYKSLLEITQFTEEEVRNLTLDDLLRLSDAQKKAFTEEQRSWMTEEQLSYIQ